MAEFEPAYRRKEKHMKTMCKHCESTAHTTLEHKKHYKGFSEAKKEERAEKHMKAWTEKADDAYDRKHGIKEGSKRDVKLDHSRGLKEKHYKGGGSSPFDSSHAVQPYSGGPGARQSTTQGKIALGGWGRTTNTVGRKAPRSGYSEADMGDMSAYGQSIGVHKKGFPRAPKGAHGRAAVHAIGQTKTTGRFAEIERTKGKGAAIAAYQNKLAKHEGKPAPYHG